MSPWQRHAGGRKRTERSRTRKLRTGKLRTGLAEGSIVYGELKASEDALGFAANDKSHDKIFVRKNHARENHTRESRARTTLSLRLAERGRLCFFPVEETREAHAGEVVRAKLLKKGEVFYAQVLESLGRFDGDVSFLSALSLQQQQVRTDFSSEVLSEAASLEGYTYTGEREDFRELGFVTIDGGQARDFDDAVHAEEREGGGWLVRVAIADVAHYVRCGSRLDEEARARGNSRYLADRVVPMLPPRMSEDLCSLRAGEDRPCLMAEMRLDAAGRLQQSRFARVVIRVSARLTYEETQQILDKRTRGEETHQEIHQAIPDAMPDAIPDAMPDNREQAVLRLYGAWRALARARQTRGALEIVREEHAARLERGSAEDSRGTLRCVGVSSSWSSDAHRLIEDTMILANVAVAEHLSKASVGFVARAHEPPSMEKWQGFEKDLSTLGLSSLLAKADKAESKKAENKTGGAERSGEGLRSRLRAVLAGVAEREELVSFLASEAILRAQSQARYVRGGGGGGEHFALALDCYCHFTSPIRRYADLCVHRALLGLLGLGEEMSVSSSISSSISSPISSSSSVGSSVTSSLCEGLIANERSAVMLERVVFQRMVCACLAAREGVGEEVFEGVVVKVMGFGFFVRLTPWGVEGVVMRGSFVRYHYARAREEAEVEGEGEGEDAREGGMRDGGMHEGGGREGGGRERGRERGREGIRIAFGVRVRVTIKESDAISGRLELSFLELSFLEAC